MKKSAFIFLLFFVFLLGLSNSFASNNEITDDIMIKQARLLEKYDCMLKEYSDERDFSTAFGGAYLEGDELHLNFVAGKMKAQIYQNIADKYGFTINYVEHSQKELDETVENISEVMLSEEIVSVRRNDKLNSVEVEVNDLDNAKVSRLKDVSYISNIQFTDVDYEITSTAVEVINGTMASIGSTGFTVGFAAYRNGKEGFVIPGHVALAGYGVGDSVTYNGRNSGEIKALQFGGTVDAAFVECRKGLFVVDHYPSRKFFNGVSYYQAAIDPAYFMTGLIVTGYEGVSGVQSGEVLSINFSYTANGTTITNAVQADYESTFGDSGSPIAYTHWAGGLNYVWMVMGTQSASLLPEGQWVDGVSCSLLTTVTHIHTELGLTHY